MTGGSVSGGIREVAKLTTAGRGKKCESARCEFAMGSLRGVNLAAREALYQGSGEKCGKTAGLMMGTTERGGKVVREGGFSDGKPEMAHEGKLGRWGKR